MSSARSVMESSEMSMNDDSMIANPIDDIQQSILKAQKA